jgi:hypothetical protein
VGFGSAYLSDPEGALRIHIKDASTTEQVRQGSKMAEFLVCRACGILVAAYGGGRYGSQYLNQ